MTLPEPYYQDERCTIYCGDCREVMPHLGTFDLLLTDPPYGIGRDRGMGGAGYDGFGRNNKRAPRRYLGGWDNEIPVKATFDLMLGACKKHIVWGGNYMMNYLPAKPKWIVWDKEQTMPSYSDAELGWTSLPGVSVKIYRHCGAGLMAVEKERMHPTQKPLALMRWCLTHVPDAETILDPFMGSGTTLVAAKLEGRKAVGIEINERYCESAAKRLEQGVLF